jgi:hypothetical protein
MQRDPLGRQAAHQAQLGQEGRADRAACTISVRLAGDADDGDAGEARLRILV